jgi:hypothetical protein
MQAMYTVFDVNQYPERATDLKEYLTVHVDTITRLGTTPKPPTSSRTRKSQPISFCPAPAARQVSLRP